MYTFSWAKRVVGQNKKIGSKRIKVSSFCNQAAGIVLPTTRADLLVKLSKPYLNPMG